jgi:hypothetical protein
MKIGKTLTIGILAALVALSSCRQKPRKTIDVPMSQARYSQGYVLSSRGFGGCSAVILDYKNMAVMAHVPLPFDQAYLIMTEQGYDPGEYARFPKEWEGELHTENVVGHLSSQMKERGIDPKEGVAFVNAGCKRGLDRIINDLEKAGIKIAEARLDSLFRDVEYNPRTDSLIVRYR